LNYNINIIIAVKNQLNFVDMFNNKKTHLHFESDVRSQLSSNHYQ